MAEFTHGSDLGFSEGGGAFPVAAVTNWAAAALSVALVAGLGWWGYRLLVRDVSGVPVVRAIEGPMRIAPEDPGGEVTENQGLSVTQVARAGTEEDPSDRVVLAPPPVELTEEDQPIAAMIPDTPSVAPEAAADGAAAPKSAIEMAIAEALSETDDATPAAKPVRVAPGSLRHSPRPRARPDTVPAPALAGVEVDVAGIAPGTRLVQLGAFPTTQDARAAWDDLDSRFGDFFADKTRVVQEASAGSSTFYRLRAMGFDALADARRFCAVLVAEGANCIPVIRR